MSTEPALPLLDPGALARLKGLQLRARRVADGVLQGLHKSPHHGSSIEFAEHKEYAPGDDARHIDWKAYGRLDKVYVKKFEQETNLRGFLLLDASASMAYGRRGGLSKFEFASVLAAALSYLLLRQQDAVALVTFADVVRQILPPRARTSHLTVLTEALEATRPSGQTALAAGVRSLSELARKRGMVFVFSDFFDELDATFALLRQLVGRGHQVTLFQVLDGDELDFPFEALTLFEGLETGARLLVEPRLVRDLYLRRLLAHQADLRSRALGARIDVVAVDTRRPPEEVLLHFLSSREAARRKGGGRAR